VRIPLIATLCVAVAVPLAADVRNGGGDEEFRADVVVQTVDPNRVVMTIDNLGEGRFGAINCVFSIRSESAFPAPISLRLADARVIVHANHVIAVSGDGNAVVFGHSATCDGCTFPASTKVFRFVGFELTRYFGDGKLGRAKASAARPTKECQAGGDPSLGCGLTGCETANGLAPGCKTACVAGYYSCCYCEAATICGCYKQ
jgi:hypothetical protein